MANQRPDRSFLELSSNDEPRQIERKFGDHGEQTIDGYRVKKNESKKEYEIFVDEHNIVKVADQRIKELRTNLETYFKHALSAIKNTEEQIETVRNEDEERKKDKDKPDDYIVPTPITKESQHTFTKRLFKLQSDFRIDKQEKENDYSFKNWKESSTSRPRLVVIDPKGISTKDLAERIVNAGVIERLLFINGKDVDQEKLKEEIKIQLHKKYTNATDKDAIAGIEGEDAYIDMEEPPISHVMGPHLIQDDSTIDKDTLESRFPQMFSSVQEAILYADDEQTANNFQDLGNTVNGGIQTVAIKKSNFEDDVTSNYTYAGRSNGSSLKLITSSKSSDEILAAKNHDDTPEISLNPKYSSMLSETALKSVMEEQELDSGEHVTEVDVDKIQKLILDQFLYDPNISPKSINPIISGATSMVQIQKSNAVYQELLKALYQKYSSSAVELTYAITNMTRDGGSDQVQEGLAEAWRYKSFFHSTLAKLRKQGIKEDEAIKIAFTQTFDTYIGIEKLNKSIYELERSRTGAQAYRNYSIEHVNKVVASNKKGLKVLGVAPWIFAASSVLVVVGLISLFPPVGLTAAAVGFYLASGSLGIGIVSRAVSGISMYFQKKANRRDLTKSTIASADANLKKNQAQAMRNTLLAERKKELSEKIELLDPKNIKHETLGKIKTTSDKPLEYFFKKEETKEVKKRFPFASFGFRYTTRIAIPENERENHISKESKDEIEEKINILIKHNVDGGINSSYEKGIKDFTKKIFGKSNRFSGKLSTRDKVDKKSIRAFTKRLFASMAERSNLSTTEEHKNCLEKKNNSAAYRSRLVIIETPEENEDINTLAETIYKASPQERILLIGLEGDKKNRLMNKIRDLLAVRLKNCKNYKDLDGNVTNDRRFIAHEIASILQRDNKLDEISRFIKGHSRVGEEYNEEDPDVIIRNFIDICDNPDNLDDLKTLIPDELLIKPHLFQEDKDISKETLNERYPHYEENIEEMLVLCSDKDVAKQAFRSSVEVKDEPIPVFIIKSKEFEENDTGDFHCACLDHESYEAVLEDIASAKSATELIGVEKVEENFDETLSVLSQNAATVNSNFNRVKISPVFGSLFNLNNVKNKLTTNRDKVSKEDLNYMQTILFDEALYEANMSPEKSTQTISKSDSKLASLAGEFVAKSLNSNFFWETPRNAIEEVKYAISFMALDTGVDFEDELLKNKNLYRSIFQKLKQSYTEKGIDSVAATEKAYIDTLDFFIDIKNDKKLKDKKLEGEISREMAYTNVNRAIAYLKNTRIYFKPLPVISVLSLGLAIASVAAIGVATFGVGFAIPLAVGIASAGVSTGFYLARLGLLYGGLRKNRETNKELIPRSNFFSKDATFKLGDAFKKVEQLKDKLVAKKIDNTKEQIIANNHSQKNKYFRKIDELRFTEMVVLKKEIKNIRRELISDKKYDKSVILSSILNKITSKKEWNTESPLELLKKRINKSKLEPQDKRKFITRLIKVKRDNEQIDKLARKMGRRTNI